LFNQQLPPPYLHCFLKVALMHLLLLPPQLLKLMQFPQPKHQLLPLRHFLRYHLLPNPLIWDIPVWHLRIWHLLLQHTLAPTPPALIVRSSPLFWLM
jgi:hypothetical protein